MEITSAAELEALVKLSSHLNRVYIVSSADKAPEIDESKEIETLDIGVVINVCDAVITFSEKVIDYKKGFEQYERKTKELLSKADKIKGKENKDDDAKDAAAAARSLATGIGAAMRNMGTSITNVINYGMNLSRAALVYANSSLNQYKD